MSSSNCGGGWRMSTEWKSVVRVMTGAAAATLIAVAPIAMKAQAPGGGRGGGGGGIGPQLFAAFDADKDGGVTAAEPKTTFDAWYDAADTQKSGSVTQEQLSSALNAAFGPPAATAPPAAGGGRGPGGAPGRGPVEFVAGASTPGLNDPCGG